MLNQLPNSELTIALCLILYNIWTQLRKRRMGQGLTIEQAAELIGVSTTTYSRWERRKQRPHPKHYQRLASTLLEKDHWDFHWKEHQQVGNLIDNLISTLPEKSFQCLVSTVLEQEAAYKRGELQGELPSPLSEIRIVKLSTGEK